MSSVQEIIENKEEIIRKIVESTGMSRDEVEQKIAEKVEEYGGLLTESGAAFALAKELGVDVGTKEQLNEWVDIKDVNEDTGFVSVAGVVKAITPIKKWDKNGSAGEVVRVLLADGTGDIWVTLWNQDAELVEKGKIDVGTVLGIKNGVVKRGFGDRLEVNTNMRSRIIIDAKVDKELPSIGEAVKISRISTNTSNATVYARVERIFQKTEFERNGRRGKVASVILNDGDRIRLVLWGDNADLIDHLKPGDVLKIENAVPKENNGSIELHANWMSRIKINPEDAPELPEIEVGVDKDNMDYKRVKIADISEGKFEVRGVVAKIYPPTMIRVCPKCGAIVDDICPEHGEGRDSLVLNIEIDDGTGVLRGVLFRDLAEKFLELESVTKEEINRGMHQKLGEEFVFGGQVKTNSLFERLEMHIRYFKVPNVDEEIKILRGE